MRSVKTWLTGLGLIALAAWSYWPDPVIASHRGDVHDYALPSIHLAQGKGLVHIANGIKHPPEHAFGVGVLMAPVYAVLGPDLWHGAFVMTLAGVVTVLLTYRLGRLVFNRRVGMVAALLLVVANLFRLNAQAINSDVVAACLTVAAHVVLLRVLARPKGGYGLCVLLGQIVGLGVAVRPDNILVLLPMAGLWLVSEKRWKRDLVRMLLVGVGLAPWVGSLFVANYLYTGDVLRTGHHVIVSPYFDTGKWLSLKRLIRPQAGQSNLKRILQGARSLWCLHSSDTDRFKQWFYYLAGLLFTVGMVRSALASGPHRSARACVVWIAIWIGALAVFFGCFWYPFEPEYFQRVTPYICLMTAVGAVTIWDAVSAKLPAPTGGGARRWRKFINEWAPWTLRGLARSALLAAGVGSWAYLFWRPDRGFTMDHVPMTQYLKYLGGAIPEKDALIVTSFSTYYVEHFIVGDSQRECIPLHRYTRGGYTYLQWRKPPHPEWIWQDLHPEDYTRRYRRMLENGAQDIYPSSAMGNQSAIDTALREGRAVYLIVAGEHIGLDRVAVDGLQAKYDLRIIEEGLPASVLVPTLSRELAKEFQFVQISPRPKTLPGDDFRITR